MSDYVWLLPTVIPSVDGDNLVLRKSAKITTIEKIGHAGLNCLKGFNGTSTLAELQEKNSLSEVMAQALEKLGYLVLLEKPISSVETYLTRQVSYYAHIWPKHPDRMLRNISEKSVVIVGVGGIGSHAALNLAGGGVKKMFLIDFDTIDHSNLNRQILFNRSDIGKSKSEVVRNEILEKFEIDVTSIVANCDDQGFNFPAADLIMVCGECEGVYDRPEKIGRVPVIRGGYDGKNGIIGPLLSINHGTPDWQNAVGQTPGRSHLKPLDFCQTPALRTCPKNWLSHPARNLLIATPRFDFVFFNSASAIFRSVLKFSGA